MSKRDDSWSDSLQVIGPTEWRGNRHWYQPWLVRDALCPDGRRRTVYLGQEADTWFSWPGRVKIGGKWIRGFVTIATDNGLDSGEQCDTVFTPNRGE